MSTPPFDMQKAHRWFAVELNNQTWGFIEAANLSPDDAERMIHAAHGACYHWLQVGDLLNHLRAQCLLATAYAKAGLAEPAVRHAAKCLQLSEEAGEKQTAFDRATAHGCAATAYKLAGRMDEAQKEHKLACTAADQFEDAGDRPVFDQLYPAP
jgi:hypothetical protein